MKGRDARVFGRVLTTALLTLAAAGCGGEDWDPAGIGPTIEGETRALTDPTAPAPSQSMQGDLFALPAGEAEAVSSALTGSENGGKAGDPKVFYLFFADGNPLPKTEVNACKGTPPAFKCNFAPTLAECQKQIMAYLDKWYADFNIIFTLTRPTSGKFYTEVISSGGGAWCGVDEKVAGVSPFMCKDIQGGVAYTFLGGENAKQTAVIIAQEQAHLVGLEHTVSGKDLMYPTICSDCEGFVDRDLQTDGDRCDRKTQNSHEMMKDRLGVWPGGPKPSVFGCMTDEQSPGVQIMEPKDGAKVSGNFTVRVDARDDCELKKVQIAVSPQSLTAESKTPPFQWDLTNITGQQTIVVTATDGMGHTTTATVTVTAPLVAAYTGDDPAAMPTAGCTVASGAFSLAGLLPSVAMLMLFSRRRRRVPTGRRRLVSGALAGAVDVLTNGGGRVTETRDATDAEGEGELPSGAPASAMAGAAAQIPLRR